MAAAAVIIAAMLSAGATVWAARIARDVRSIRISINGRLDRLIAELREVEDLADVHPTNHDNGDA